MTQDDQTHTGEPLYRVTRPVMTQQWRSLSYLHWRYDPAAVQALLPPGLTVDTFDGAAWVGLVPFEMVDIAVAHTPPIPYFGTFPETNVRTYVRGASGPGVWFHSLDINRLVPVLVAQATYRLPYLWDKMSITHETGRIGYRARRRWPGPRPAASALTVEYADRITEPDDLAHFLSARWGLYSLLGKRLAYARVEHEPWPLHDAEVVELADDFVTAAGYPPPAGPPHVMYSPGVSVRIERPRSVAATGRP